jgi:hypothetical protein
LRQAPDLNQVGRDPGDEQSHIPVARCGELSHPEQGVGLQESTFNQVIPI